MCVLCWGNGVTVGGWGGCCPQSVGRLCVCFGVLCWGKCKPPMCVHCWGKVVTVGGLGGVLSSKCRPPMGVHCWGKCKPPMGVLCWGNGVTVGGGGGGRCCPQSVGRLWVCIAGVSVSRLWVCFAGVMV